MKKLFKLLLAGLIIGAAAILAACAGDWEPPYEDLDKQGYTVSVRYDINGGVFGSTSDMYVIDVYKLEDAVKGVPLLEPNNPLRGDNAYTISHREKYFHVGWYQNRELRVDADGNALDVYGQKCSDSGLPQGYIYSDPWDFEGSLFTVDANGDYNSADNTMTLYAAWVPYFTYEFYAVNPATGAFEKYDTLYKDRLSFPVEEEGAVSATLRDFSKRDNMTFISAYLDPDMTVTHDPSQPLTGTVDYEHGIVTDHTLKIYTEWREGTWYKIYTAQQFYKNSHPNASYEIMADLDFSEIGWSPALPYNHYTGHIIGNGHTFRNITVTQGDVGKVNGGLFGVLTASAKIEDLTLENITYTIAAGSKMPDASFGLLAGSMYEGATLSGVTVKDSQLIIDAAVFPSKTYNLGLLCGSGMQNAGGIDLSGITCTAQNNAAGKIQIEVLDDGSITLTFMN